MNNIGIGLIVWNGEAYIAEAIKSLLNQEYKDLHIYVLDNLSTDATVEIVKNFAIYDDRITCIVDTNKKNIAEAQSHIFSKYLSRHKYCMFACDDDFYDPKYISEIIESLFKEDLDLVYTDFQLFSDNEYYYNNSSKPIYGKTSHYLEAGSFLLRRNCIPLFFGIFKASHLRNSMKYFRMVDNYGFNHENLMLFHFILNNKIKFIDKILFNYRDKERILLYKNRGYSSTKSAFKTLLNSLINNFNFSIEIIRIINISNINKCKKIYLYLFVVISYLYRTFIVFIINIYRAK